MTSLPWFDDGGEPSRRDGLSRERVVAAAVAAADADPHRDVTMRDLAGDLGVRSPMALYRWVGGSKAGLHDLMADTVYGEMTVPDGAGWRTGLQGLGESAWAAVQRHPWFARLAFSRPPLGPHALAVHDRALALLDGHDLDAATRMGCVQVVLGHVLGAGLAQLEETAMRARTGLATERDLADAAQPYLDRIADSGRYPHFSAWAGDPGRLVGPPWSVAHTLGWLLDGLAATVEGRASG